MSETCTVNKLVNSVLCNRGADKSLAPPGRKQATATEDFDVHHNWRNISTIYIYIYIYIYQD